MTQLIEIKVPDIGDYKEIPVIELLVKVGDQIAKEQSLITLESDKATMDIPSAHAGIVKEIKVKLGDAVSEGTLVLLLEATIGAGASPLSAKATAAPPPDSFVPAHASIPVPIPAPVPTLSLVPSSAATAQTVELHQKAEHFQGPASHASPSVRKYARELGADINLVKGTGPKGRITQEDVQGFIKGVLSQPAKASTTAVSGGNGLTLLPWPKIDFNKFGETKSRPLSRIQKISAANLARNWAMIPAVTYHEDADITDLEAFRVQTNQANEKLGIKVTLLAFLMKACVKALKKYPDFNSSLDGEDLILKQYFHLGFAADTPNGLVVPVIRQVDQKDVVEIAQEMSTLAKLAREGKLKPDQMQGACFTISSVGGIGGKYFSPIINAPEVAILGVSKAAMRPIWNGEQFVPRLICPLSLSADHRVIDGALATRFNAYIAELITDFRRVTL